MPGPRDYVRSTVMGLAHLSGGLCYRPGCPEPVFRWTDGEIHLIVEIAHIRAAKKGGPRYDENMTDEQRRHISNLMLFCDPHHDIVDQHWEQYPPETLRRWKTQREAKPNEALKRLRDVTPAGLRKIVAEGLEDHDSRLLQALDRLNRTDRETAGLVRGLIDELTEAYTWQSRNVPDPEILTAFGIAVDKLWNIQETMAGFSGSVERLSRMPMPEY